MAGMYPNLAISIEGASLIPGEGIRIRDLSIMRPADMGLAKRGELAYADELFLSCDTSMLRLVQGDVSIDHVRIRGLLIRATCEADGTWSLSQFLPLPQRSGNPPTVSIEEATLEVIDRRNNPPSVLMLENIRLAAAPVAPPESATAFPADSPPPESWPDAAAAASRDSVALPPPSASADWPPVQAAGSLHGPKWLQVLGAVTSDHFRRAEFRALIDPTNGSWTVTGSAAELRLAPELTRALPIEIAACLREWDGLRATTNLTFSAARDSPSDSAAASPLPERNYAAPSGGFTAHDSGPRSDAVERAALIAPASFAQRADSSPIRFVVEGQVIDGRFTDPGLPQDLTDLRVESFRCENLGGTVRNATARLGDATLQASLTSNGWNRSADWGIAASVTNFNVTRDLVDMLPPAQQALWYRYQPLGRVNAALKLSLRNGQLTSAGMVQCEDVSLLCDRFPYPLQRVSGTVALDEGRHLAVDLWGTANRTPVRIRADVQDPGPEFQGTVQVTSSGPVPVDDTLLTALNPGVRTFLTELHPQGEAAVDAILRRNAATGGDLHKLITINVSKGYVRYEPFSYPLQDVQGTIVIDDEDWKFEGLQGKNDSCLVKCDGELRPTADDRRRLLLHFTATDVPCEDELRDALPAGPRRLWQGLRPRGSIDRLEVDVSHVTGQTRPDIDIVLNQFVHEQDPDRRTLMVQPVWFPYRMEEVTGTLVYHRDGRFELQNIRAAHGSVRLDSRGEGFFAEDGNWRVTMDRVLAERVLVDRELLQALPGGLGDTLAQMRFSGSLGIGGRLDFLGTSDPEIPVNAAWDLQVNLDDARLSTMGHHAEHVYGVVRVIGRRTGQLVRNSGLVNIDSVMYRGVQLRQIQGPWWLDDQKLVFGQHAPDDGITPPTNNLVPDYSPSRVRATVFGGVVEAEGAVALADDGPFQVNGLITGADLRVLAHELLLPHEIYGRADASLELRGSKLGIHTWQGSGSVRLRQANIYRLPAIISLLNEMRVTQEDPRAFTASDLDFRIQGDHLYFSRFDLHGESLTLKGQGEMGFDRRILIDFYTILGGENRWLPFMRNMVGQASKQFLMIRVSGTLDNIQMTREVLPGLNERLQILFPELTPSAPGTTAAAARNNLPYRAPPPPPSGYATGAGE